MQKSTLRRHQLEASRAVGGADRPAIRAGAMGARWRLALGTLVVVALLGVGFQLPGSTSSGASGTPSVTASLVPGQTLGSGQTLTKGFYTLTMKPNGGLVERWNGVIIWGSGTAGHPGSVLSLGSNGLLSIIYNHTAIWTSGVSGSTTTSWVFRLETGGNFVVVYGLELLWSSATQTSGIRFAAATGPVFSGDAPDPTALNWNGTWYAFTTGTPLGNSLQALVLTDLTGFHSYTGMPWGSTALPSPPGWQQPGTQNAPSVVYMGGAWHMFYDAYPAGTSFGSGQVCLAEATALSISPSGPVFSDSSAGPLLCQPQYGGSLDPSAYYDATTGRGWLVWKTNDGSSGQASHIWAQEINPTGNGLLGSPQLMWTNNTVAYSWETTLDNPDLVLANGRWFLLFSSGSWTGLDYGQAYLTCSSPLGPCTQPDSQEFLTSWLGGGPQVRGPGGGSLAFNPGHGWELIYAAWGGGYGACTSYACGAVRELYMAPIDLGG